MGGRSRHQFVERRPRQVYRIVQEKLYFNHLKSLIHQCAERIADVEFLFYCSNGGSPMIVVDRAANIPILTQKVRVAIFDHDNNEQEFIRALDKSKEEHIISAYSNICFDLWLILHKRRFERSVNNARDYESTIREVYNLQANADIKNEDIMTRILSQIRLPDIRNAIENAVLVLRNNEEVGIPVYTKKAIKYFSNPDLMIHQFVQMILNDTGCNTCN